MGGCLYTQEAGVQCLTALSKALSPSLLPGTSGDVGGGRELKELTEMVLKGVCVCVCGGG